MFLRKSLKNKRLLECGFISFLLVVFVSSCSPVSVRMEEEVKTEFQKVFKNTPVSKVSKSEIPGVYEVYVINNTTNSGNLIYFYPEKKLIIFGEIWTLNGTSITAEKLLRELETKSNKN